MENKMYKITIPEDDLDEAVSLEVSASDLLAAFSKASEVSINCKIYRLRHFLESLGLSEIDCKEIEEFASQSHWRLDIYAKTFCRKWCYEYH